MNNLNYFDCDMVHPILDRVTKCTETVLPFFLFGLLYHQITSFILNKTRCYIQSIFCVCIRIETNEHNGTMPNVLWQFHQSFVLASTNVIDMLRLVHFDNDHLIIQTDKNVRSPCWTTILNAFVLHYSNWRESFNDMVAHFNLFANRFCSFLISFLEEKDA